MLKLLTTLTISTFLVLEGSASVIEKRQAAPGLTQYIVNNRCPAAINLFISGQYDSTITQGGNTTKFLSGNPGLFYTDANGGRGDGSRAVKAGFFPEVSYLASDKAERTVNCCAYPLVELLLLPCSPSRLHERWDANSAP